MNSGDKIDQGTLLNRMTSRIRQSLELQEILSATVVEMRAFLNTDRVKVYRFQSDGTGQVIAESVNQNRLPALLNLHFPEAWRELKQGQAQEWTDTEIELVRC